MRKTGRSEANRCCQAGTHSSAKVTVRGPVRSSPLQSSPVCSGTAFRHAGSGSVGPTGRPFKGLQDSDAIRPWAPCALPRLWHRAARVVLPQPVLPTANRPGAGPADGAPCARRPPRRACSQLHAGRPQSRLHRARGVVWIPAPNARLCLCRQSRICCREWHRR